MKRTVSGWMFVVLIAGAAWSQQSNTSIVRNNQLQNATAIGGGNADSVSTATAESGIGVGWSNSYSEGGIGWSDSDSVAVVNISTSSTTNVKNRTPPMTTYPPYLPIWNHGGWGTINAYFVNGPTTGDAVYQRRFDPSDPKDMQELKGMLTSLPYENPIAMLGGMVNGIVALFGGPDNYQQGRGFEIANSLVRDRRPTGKALIVFIDSLIDPQLLKEAGYAYVGRLSIEGRPDRNWDQVYSAAVAEALPWDVDLLLVSGGMKGVTVGSNVSFPSGSVGFSQTNYSLSLFGGYASGITEGKGEAVVSASAYRFCPELLRRRHVPESLFEKLRRQQAVSAVPAPAQVPEQAVPAAAPTAQTIAPEQAVPAPARTAQAIAPENAGRTPSIEVSRELYEMAGIPAPIDYVNVK
jgi:hypothetical protein